MKKTLLFACLLFQTSIFAQEVPLKRLYLGNDTHVDLMYNGTEEKWSQLILEMSDFYLKLGESTVKEEPAKQSKWNYDCAYNLWVLENKTSPAYFQRIIAQIKNQQASVPYNFTLPLYGASTAESVLRSFYYGGHLERKYGIDVDIAVCQENATIPLGLTSLWAGSGAKYSWKGVCNCASKSPTIGTRKNEIYWNTGLDGQRTLMKWYSNYGWNAELGGYAENLEPTMAVIKMDTMCGTKRYPYRIAAAFGKGWDNMINLSYDMQWGVSHRTRPGTKVFVSNELDFFKDFETTYGDKLPAETLSYGNEWDLLPASLMTVTGGIRRSMEKLRNAEAMASIIVVDNPDAFINLENAKKDAFYAISVISAHGWTIDHSVTKKQFADWARIQEYRIRNYSDSLLAQSAKLLSEKIITKGINKRFYAFNALNWVRTDVNDLKYNGSKNIIVSEVDGKKQIPFQFIEKNGSAYLRIMAENIPSVGYKVFEILENKVTNNQQSFFKRKGNNFETNFYRITLTNEGAISSLIDKKSGKDFAKQTNGKYLNDLDITTNPIKKGKSVLTIENSGAISFTIKSTSAAPMKHISKITLYKNSPRIDIENEINQNFTKPVYHAYSFNIDNPTIWHEEVGAVVKAKYESEGGHYSNHMSRVDHLSLNHFADVSNEKEGITLSDLDCLFMKVGNSETQKLDSKSAQINILAGGQIDENFNLGIPKQDGDSLFFQNYALLPHISAFNQTNAMKFALEHQNPLVSEMIKGGNDLDEKQYSFLKTDNKDLLLWALKPAEDGGVAARFWNMGMANETKIDLTKKPKIVNFATHVETVINEIPVVDNGINLKTNQQQMKTVLIGY